MIASEVSAMAQITIRNLPDEVVARLKEIAASNGRSLEAELRLLLQRHARGAIAAEEAPPYETDAYRRALEPLPKVQKFRYPKPVKYPKVTPIKVEGKPVSETLIEDRR
jgi:plasmid stability protein